MEDFLSALWNELDSYAGFGKGTVFGTVFLGGGTPSLLTPAQMEGILSHLHRRFAIAGDAEITVETNPGTATEEKLEAYRALGVNRLSIGVQSFDPRELEFLSRIHTREQALECVSSARKAGFENFSIDLIYALPGQTRARWMKNLEQAVGLAPPHLSAYGLIVEDGTPLARMVAAKQVSPAPTDLEAGLYEATMEYLDARGYEHYEVSNYAQPGYRSVHNYNYWTHGRYLGFGPSAHSFWHEGEQGDSAKRWWNIRSLSGYCQRLLHGESPRVSDEVLGTPELLTERVFLGLRSDGLDLAGLETDFGVLFGAQEKGLIDDLLRGGLATVREGKLRLSSRGYLVCDEICVRLLKQTCFSSILTKLDLSAAPGGICDDHMRVS